MSKFVEWLSSSSIKDMDTVKGDLARYIVSDDNFPDTDDRCEIYRYIEANLIVADPQKVLGEFLELYNCYQKLNKPH